MERFREACLTSSSDINFAGSLFVTHREKLEKVDFVVKKFLHKKIIRRTFICGLCCAAENIPEDACS